MSISCKLLTLNSEPGTDQSGFYQGCQELLYLLFPKGSNNFGLMSKQNFFKLTVLLEFDMEK